MTMKERILERGKKLATSGVVARLISNDRVMRVATGVMDARTRVGAAGELAAEAWSVLLNGHALPVIDPALEGSDEVKATPRSNGRSVHAPTPTAASAPNPSNGGATSAPTVKPTVENGKP